MTTKTKNKTASEKASKQPKAPTKQKSPSPDDVSLALLETPKAPVVSKKPEPTPEPVQSFDDRMAQARDRFWAKAMFTAIYNKNLAMNGGDKEQALDATVQHMVRRRK